MRMGHVMNSFMIVSSEEFGINSFEILASATRDMVNRRRTLGKEVVSVGGDWKWLITTPSIRPYYYRIENSRSATRQFQT
jgi:hypothetical protein